MDDRWWHEATAETDRRVALACECHPPVFISDRFLPGCFPPPAVSLPSPLPSPLLGAAYQLTTALAETAIGANGGSPSIALNDWSYSQFRCGAV